MHIVTATVRNADRQVVEFDTLCDLTIQGSLMAGEVTCVECLRRDGMSA